MATSAKFLETWRKARGSSKNAIKAMMPPAQPPTGSIGEVEELIASVEYVSNAAELMAKTPEQRRSSLERDGRLRARRARTLGRSVLSKGLDAVRSYRAIGLLDQSSANWKKSCRQGRRSVDP